MIAAIKRFLRRQRTEHLRRKALHRHEATEAFRAAVRRGDTRRQHETWPEAHRATNELLRSEMGR